MPAEGAGIDGGDLIRFVRGKLAGYKVPREIRLLEALPRNATGKILKTELRRLAAVETSS